MIDRLPIIAICGWSGSGKTTLIEALLPRLRERGLQVAVLKHDVHGIEVDRPGKDSDRLFRVGADVLLQGPDEESFRAHRAGADDWRRTLLWLAARCDLVLVEGHKGTPLPKMWLLSERESEPPREVAEVVSAVFWDADRPAVALPILVLRPYASDG